MSKTKERRKIEVAITKARLDFIKEYGTDWWILALRKSVSNPYSQLVSKDYFKSQTKI